MNEYLAVPGVSGLSGRRRLRRCPVWLRNGKIFPANRPARFAGGGQGGEEQRSRDPGRPLKPFVFTTLEQLATIGRRTGVAMIFGVQLFRFNRLGNMAKHLFNEATASGQEAPRHDGLDAGSFVWPRDRTDDHFARCPSAKRSAGSHSSSNKARIRRTNQFSNQRQEFMTYG